MADYLFRHLLVLGSLKTVGKAYRRPLVSAFQVVRGCSQIGRHPHDKFSTASFQLDGVLQFARQRAGLL